MKDLIDTLKMVGIVASIVISVIALCKSCAATKRVEIVQCNTEITPFHEGLTTAYWGILERLTPYMLLPDETKYESRFEDEYYGYLMRLDQIESLLRKYACSDVALQRLEDANKDFMVAVDSARVKKFDFNINDLLSKAVAVSKTDYVEACCDLD